MNAPLIGREKVDAYAAKWNVWQAGEVIGSLCGNDSRPLERPEPVRRTAARLTRFPPCAICGLHVSDCDCDPDEAMGAAMTALLNQRADLENRRDA